MRHLIIAFLRSVIIIFASSLLFINVVIVLYGIFMRYLSGGAPIWTDELARYLMVSSVMIAMGAVWIEAGHMRIDLLEKLLPKFLSRIIIFYQWIVTTIIAFGAAYFTYHYAGSVAMFHSPGLGISRSIPMYSMPIGFITLGILSLLHGPKRLQPNLERSSC